MNPESVLIDTSAGILGFKKGTDQKILDFIKKSISADLVVTTQLIILELVQGCKTAKERDDLHRRLESLSFIELTPDVWKTAYTMAYSLRRKGITVPSVDILIAALAQEYECILLHFDRHYEMIGRYNKKLKLKYLA